jgi:hypothetical protein
MMRDASALRELVSLLTGANVVFKDVRAQPARRPRPGEDKTVWVVRPSSEQWTSTLGKGWHIVSFRDFAMRARSVLAAWFAGRDLDRTALDLYFAARQIDELPLEFRYLCTLQAIERHHRRYYLGRYMSHQRYDLVKGKIVSALPRKELSEGHYESLKTKIRFGNEKSLRNRLRELCSELPASFFERLTWDAKTIPNVLADVRNDLTHYQTNARRRAAQEKLYDAVNASLAITSALFLKRLGFDAASIERGMSRHKWMTASSHPFGPHGRPFGDRNRASVWVAGTPDDATWETFVGTQLALALGVAKLDQFFIHHAALGSRQALGRWATKTEFRKLAKPAIVSTLDTLKIAFPIRILIVDQFAYAPPQAPLPSPIALTFVGAFDKKRSRRRR